VSLVVPERSAPNHSWWPSGWLVAAVALVLASYGVTAWRVSGGRLVQHEPAAYYELLTDAVVHGRTSLRLEPDPRLAQLENPWAGPQGIPRAHDATYFQGRYYLYFGVTPVVLVLAPWRWLTGTFLTDPAAILVFLSLGYLLALDFVLRSSRALGRALRPPAAAGVALALGWGSFLHYNLAGAQFYQVPIACAFACTMAAARCLLGASQAHAFSRVAAGFAGASFFAGAAVGARPNFIFVLPLLGVAGATLAAMHPAVRGRRHTLVALAALVVPALLGGLALAGYNYARFGDPLEFGLRYQFAAIDMRAFKLFGPEFFGRSVDAYLFSPARYSLYYPFIGLREETFGLLTWAPAALLALAAPALARRAGATAPGRTWVTVSFVAGAGLAMLAVLLFYAYQLERYELDFLGPLLVAAAVVALVTWSRLPRLARLVVAAVLAWTAVHSIGYTLPSADSAPVARVLNHLPAALERGLGWMPGPLEMDIVVPDCAIGAQQPLFATGSGRDAVFLQRTGPETFRLGFAHRGFPGTYGDGLGARPGERWRLVLDLGGLYPPAEHPFFTGWSDAEIAVLRRRVSVRCAGREVLRAESPFHPSSRLDWEFGTASELAWLEPRFAGAIVGWRVLPFDRAGVAAGLGAGPVRLRVRFPAFVGMVGEPLISTGRHGAGDLVSVFYVAPGRVRFAHDSWNSGLLESDVVAFDPEEDQVIDVDFGGLHPAAAPGQRTAGEFRLRFNGREVLHAARHYHPALASEVAFGYNAIRASTADVRFRGEKLVAERLGSLPVIDAHSGPLALDLQLPSRIPVGRSEPLLVCGSTGAADVIYLRYRSDAEAEIGYDSWGEGGPVGTPFAIRPGGRLAIQISLGSLFPGRGAGVPSPLEVRADGRRVLQAATPFRPERTRPIVIGENTIGASSCAAAFSGEIRRAQRVDPAASR
jgi:hypothetical protein